MSVMSFKKSYRYQEFVRSTTCYVILSEFHSPDQQLSHITAYFLLLVRTSIISLYGSTHPLRLCPPQPCLISYPLAPKFLPSEEFILNVRISQVEMKSSWLTTRCIFFHTCKCLLSCLVDSDLILLALTITLIIASINSTTFTAASMPLSMPLPTFITASIIIVSNHHITRNPTHAHALLPKPIYLSLPMRLVVRVPKEREIATETVIGLGNRTVNGTGIGIERERDRVMRLWQVQVLLTFTHIVFVLTQQFRSSSYNNKLSSLYLYTSSVLW